MGDLKGLLDKEGIDFSSETSPEKSPENNSKISSNTDTIPAIDIDTPEISPTELPILNGTITIVDSKESAPDSVDLDDYLSDIEDDNIELADFADTVKELEEKVESITEPEHLHLFEQSESTNVQLENLKNILQKKLALQIETEIDKLKINLLTSMELEINQLFENLPKK